MRGTGPPSHAQLSNARWTSALAVVPHSLPPLLRLPPLAFVGHRSGLGPAGTAALLAADLLDALLLGGELALDLLLHALAQELARPVAVHGLRAVLLSFDLDPAGQVPQLHRARCLVDLLPPGARGAHEGLLEILLPDPETLHALGQLRCLVGAHPEPLVHRQRLRRSYACG